jgi:hypothetical protein
MARSKGQSQKQTARKSTAPTPPKRRIDSILETKRQSTRSSGSPAVGKGAGKKLVKIQPKRKYRPGQLALREIRKFQQTTSLLIKKLPFQRLVRQITLEVSDETMRYKVEALAALQVIFLSFKI